MGMAGQIASRIGRLLLRRRRGLLRDDSGVTIIEFGLLALPFFSIIGAILETSVVFLTGQVLESAVQDAGRLIRTGQVQARARTGTFDLETFRETICDASYGLFGDCSGIFVSVSLISDFASATSTPPVDWACTSGCDWTEEEVFTPGSGSSIVLVQAYYRMPIIMPLGPVATSNLADGTRLMGSVTVFRNEPFT